MLNNKIKALFLGFLFLCFFTFLINLYPLKKIEKSTQKLASGSKNTNITVLGCKEFENIQENLEKLEVKNELEEEYKINLKKEYYKFVPKQFFEHLGKKDIGELKLGENVQKDVTIMFTDIRSSYKTSETLSLSDNFEFINNYLNIIGNSVRKFNGFIDKFLGDGVLSVFINESDAISCSNEIANLFENINLVSIGKNKLKYGMGLHSGKVVIGVVGEKERLTPTIISENVNLASKIENLNKILQTKILFTKELLNNLPKSFEINYRYIGTFNIDNLGVTLFENLDGFVGSDKTAYLKTKNIFESAVRNFENKDYVLANKLFIDVLKENEDDNLCKYYLKKCKYK